MAAKPDASESYLCKYCDKKVIKRTKCINCGASFHKSCSTRLACCKNQELSSETEDMAENLTSEEGGKNSINNILIESLKFENKILMELNHELKVNNELLKEKIQTLEGELNKNKPPPQLQSCVENNTEQKIKYLITKEMELFFHNNNIKENLSQKTPISINGNKNKQEDKKIQKVATISNRPNLIDLENKQRNKMQEIINLGDVNSHPTNNKNTAPAKLSEEGKCPVSPLDDEFTTPRYYRKRRNIHTGKAESIGNFQGKEQTNKNKQIWLFLSRVKDITTENDIKCFISEKTNSKDISVKLLKTAKTIPDNQCFMVGVHPSLLQMVYDENFWPQEVAYARFNFRIGQRFLDNPRQASFTNQDNSRPSSFQNSKGATACISAVQPQTNSFPVT